MGGQGWGSDKVENEWTGTKRGMGGQGQGQGGGGGVPRWGRIKIRGGDYAQEISAKFR
jgi:hypothetical protein